MSVVIPVLDDERRLHRCLAALAAQRGAIEFEVIVVDNGSVVLPRGTVAAHPYARLLVEQRRGSYAARNTGISVARGRILAFTDSDCVPDHDWLERLTAAVDRQEEPCFVAGRVLVTVEDPKHPSAAEDWEVLHAFPQERYVTRLGFGVTANLAAAKLTFDTVGVFDEELRSSGDREWGRRASRLGIVPTYSDDARVRHPARRSFAEVRRKVRRVSEGAVTLHRNDGGGLGLRLVRLAVRPPLLTIFRNGRLLGLHRGTRYMAFALMVHYLHMIELLRAHRQAERARRASLGGRPSVE